MRGRKCHTAKYRRRMRKQRRNRAIRQREELMKAGYERLPMPASAAVPPPPIIPQAIATEDYGEWLRELRNLLRVLRARIAPPVICPLCTFPITKVDEAKKNFMVGSLNNRYVVTHRTCPTEAH